MNCPRCDSVVLDERERDGIQVDSCPKCRGIWLDRGELERLVARATAAMDAAFAERAPSPRPPTDDIGHRDQMEPRRDRYDGDDEDDDDRRRYAERGGYPPRKRRWFEVFDIFD